MKKEESQPKGIKVKLTVADRYNVRIFLPEKGSMIEQIQAKSIIEKIEFTSREIEEFEIVEHPNGNIKWDEKKAKEKTVVFTTGEIEMLKTGVELRDSAKEIKLFMVDVAIKIKEWAGCPVE